jgi:peptidoglycan/xylan/chitin deacetylase (PgdA/CDA1 family)
MSLRHQAITTASSLLVRTGALRALGAWNGRRGSVIVVFHVISEPQLTRHLEVVAEHYRIVPLSELVDRMAAAKSVRGLAAVTFDDGLRDETEAGARLSVERGWPMTFYLPTRYLDTGEPYWYQELGLLLRAGRGRTLMVDDLRLPLDSDASLDAAHEALRRRFYALPSVAEVDRVLRAVRTTLTGAETRLPSLEIPPPVAWERVRALARHEGISFQAHSINHLAMSRLPPDEIRREMEGSKRRIEEMTDRPVHHFCYPYGGVAEIGSAARDVARALFRSAVTLVRGRCRPGLDPAFLPRVALYERDSEAVVATKVAMAS